MFQREALEALSHREQEVMALVVTGRLNKQVGFDLGISEITVKAHRGRAMRKMEATSLAGDRARSCPAWRYQRSDSEFRRCDRTWLETIPGIGVAGATAIVATVPDPTVFRSGRDFAAWIVIVPREDSTGGKRGLGPISKRGDRYLRRILVVGAVAVLRYARRLASFERCCTMIRFSIDPIIVCIAVNSAARTTRLA